tara:strand:+ start:824 stop:1219 length:396 start_codon:yes stop_codon:yes gene_type:complete
MDSFSQDPQEHLKEFIVKVSKLYGFKNLEGTLMAGHPNGELFQNKLEDQIEEIESEFFKLKEDLFRRLKGEKLPAPEFHPWKFVPMGKGWVERELRTIQEVPLKLVYGPHRYLITQHTFKKPHLSVVGGDH